MSLRRYALVLGCLLGVSTVFGCRLDELEDVSGGHQDNSSPCPGDAGIGHPGTDSGLGVYVDAGAPEGPLDLGAVEPVDGGAETPDASGDVDAGAVAACRWEPFAEGLVGGATLWTEFGADSTYYASTPQEFVTGSSSALVVQVPTDTALKQFALASDGHHLAATADGVWRADDAGTWRKVSLDGLATLAVAVAPSDPRIVYSSAIGTGLFRSADSGDTWADSAYGLPYGAIAAIDVDPRDARRVIVGGANLNAAGGYSDLGFTAESGDGGRTFAVRYSDAGRTHTLDRCAANPDVLIAAHVYGVSVSRDGGTTWAAVAVPGVRTVFAAAVGGAACEDLYLSVSMQGIFHSGDGGTTWDPPSTSGFTIEFARAPGELAVDPADGGHVLAPTHGGLFESLDFGRHWATVAGVGIAAPRLVRPSPTTPGRLWLATWGLGTWVRDGEAPWTRIPEIGRDFAAFVREVSTGELYSSGYRRDLAGAVVSVGPTGNVLDVAQDPANPGVIWAVTQTRGVQRSADGGLTYTPANGDLAPWVTGAGTFVDTRFVLATGGRVIAGTNGRGVVFSDDAGAHWSAARGTEARTITCLEDLGDGRLAACTTDAGFLFSTDDGTSWSPSNDGLASLDARGIVFDAATDTTYVSTSSEVYRSEGATWLPLQEGCLLAPPGPLAIHETAAGRYLVTTAPDLLIARFPLR